MTISLTPIESDVNTALWTFLLAILPSGVDVIRGQVNRVAEPSAADYLVFWPLRRSRLGTNFDQFIDAKFTGSIASAGSPSVATMTITHVFYGSLKAGSVIFGVGVAARTQVIAQTSGTPGGNGTYTVTQAPQTVASRTLAAGVLDALQPLELVVQCDVHGPSAADNATRVATMMRDDFAVQAFKALSPTVAPFYADDPKQVPFINDQQAYEDRWIVEAHLQVNATVNDLPQQFFEQIVVPFVPVDIVYPAA